MNVVEVRLLEDDRGIGNAKCAVKWNIYFASRSRHIVSNFGEKVGLTMLYWKEWWG